MSVLAFDFYAEDDPNGTPLGTLDETDCKAMELRPALHELGAISFTVSRHNTTATSALVRENNIVKVRIPSVSTDPIAAFVLKEGEFTLIDTREQGGEDLTFGGPGLIYLLSLARLHFTPYAPDQPYRGSLDADGVWTWINEPYGAILTRIIEEGQNQPGSPLADVTIDFDRVNDSDGNPWPTITETFQTPIGSDVLTVAERLTVAGDLYLRMDPDLTLHAYQASYGRDLSGSFGSGTVRFEKGVNILTQLVRKIAARDMLTHLIQEDMDGAYSLEVSPDYSPGDRAHYGFFEAGQTNDDTQLNKIAQNVLAASRTSGHAHELEVTPGFVPASGRYMPGPEGTSGHFWVGDTVTLHTGAGEHDFNGSDQIVVAIRIVLDEAADDTTDDTAARSLHIVPELNYMEVRGFGGGVAPADLGQPGFCCGPSAPIPGSPEVPATTDFYWPLDTDGFDEQTGTHEAPTPAFGQYTAGWLEADGFDTGGIFLTTPLPGVLEGISYTISGEIRSDSADGPVALRVQWYDEAAASTLLQTDDSGTTENGVVSITTTAPSGSGSNVYFRWYVRRPGGPASHNLSANWVRVAHGGIAAIPGTSGPTLGGPGDGSTGTPGTYLPVDAVIEHNDLSGEGGTMHDATQIEVTPFSTIAATNVQDALEEIVAEATGGGGSLPWFDVTDAAYGAVGDGSNDDTAEINLAIAALNSAGGGVLYFPAGEYVISSALTTITVPCIVMGDGTGGFPYGAGTGSAILQSSDTANGLTFSDDGWVVRDLAIINTEGNPTAGAGISSATGYFARMQNVTVSGFYDNIDISDGAGWSLTDSFIHDPVRYGFRIRGTVSPDSGDQSISGTYFMSDTHDGTAAIRQESAGGLKITNTKINERGVSGGEFVDGISVAIASAVNTSVLLVANSSIENVTGDAIDISNAATGSFGIIQLTGVQVGLYGNNTGRALKVVSGGGAIAGLTVTGCIFKTDGTAREAMEFTDIDAVTLGAIQYIGFNALYTQTGSTITEGGGGASALDDLTDVTITAATTDDDLRYNGAEWVNDARKWEPVTDGSSNLVFDGGDIVMDWS